MVDDSKKRGRGGHRAGHTPAGKARQSHGGSVAAADQDAFAAFTAKYRDMLRFADADEAEAVYSMVSLTQAAQQQQQQQQQQGGWQPSNPADIKGPVIEVPECRAVKRRHIPIAVPASSACSEGGRSDSSAKSAPGPPTHLRQQQYWHSLHHHHQGPSMLAAALGPPGYPSSRHGGVAEQHRQQQHQQAHGGAGLGGEVHPGALGPVAAGGMNMSMGPPFFPPGCMPGMLGGAGCAPGSCMPFMGPWGPMMPPAMMQHMMFGGLPMPPLPMPPPPGMMPFMPGMAAPMNMHKGQHSAEPAAGIPVTGPLPPAGNAFKAAAATGNPSSSTGSKGANTPPPPPAATPAAAAATKQPAPTTPAAAGAMRPAAQQQAAGAHAQAPAAAASPGTATAAGPSITTAAGSGNDLLCELEQLDVLALRPWVMSHFCEDVYFLLLDAWRPDSSKVREAVWAWKVHIKRPSAAGSAPDYRAFLVSLFGLDKLTQLTAAHAARQGSSTLVAPSVTLGATPPAVLELAAPEHTQQLAAGLPAAADAPEAVAGVVSKVPATVDGPVLVAASAEGMMMTPDNEVPCGADCEAAGGGITTSNLSSEPGAATMSAAGPHVMSRLLVPPIHTAVSATSPHRAGPPALAIQLP